VDINSNTFCAAPWFQLRNSNDGSFRCCCEIDHGASNYQGQTEYNLREHDIDHWYQSDYSQYLRQNLSQGVRLPECRRCWQKEDSGHHSLRNIVNNTVTKNASDLQQTWLAAYFKNKQDWQSDLLISADIKISNLCNFACAMCNPMDSSQIYAIWKKNTEHACVQSRLSTDPGYLDRARAIFVDNSNRHLLRDILRQRPKFLKILGGEPLLDQETRQILGALPADRARKTNLLFVTNGSQDLVKAKQQFSHFQSVSFVLSLEGIGWVQDYIRRGSNWDQISRNIENFVSVYGTDCIYVHHTLQALTVQTIKDLMQWCWQHGIPMGFGLLDTPDYMSLSSVPSHILKRTALALQEYPVPVVPPCYSQEPLIDLMGLISQLENQVFCNDHLLALRGFLDWYDPAHSWKENCTHWNEWLEPIGPISE
jgi:hypothetical protein